MRKFKISDITAAAVRLITRLHTVEHHSEISVLRMQRVRTVGVVWEDGRPAADKIREVQNIDKSRF